MISRKLTHAAKVMLVLSLSSEKTERQICGCICVHALLWGRSSLVVTAIVSG